jgi:capsular polysaccharide biosynthesis protein
LEKSGFIPLAKRWWWVLLGATLVAAVSAFVFASRLSPTYEAEVSLLTGPYKATFDTLRASGDLARTFSGFATQGPTLQSTIDELDLNRTVEDLRKSVGATSNDVTRFLTIRVQDKDPKLAADIANSLANQLIRRVQEESPTQELELVDEFMRQEEVTRLRDPAQLRIEDAANRIFGANPPEGQLRVVDPAAVPVEPVAPRVTLITVLAALAGLVGTGIFVLVRESSSEAVESERALVDLAQLPFLGSVDSLGKRKSGEPLVVEAKPGSREADAYRLLAARIGLFDNESSIRSLLVIGVQQGDGSGLLAANLAAVLAKSDWHVTLVDANNSEGEITTALGLADRPGYGELLAADPELTTNGADLKNLRVSRTDDFDVLPRGSGVQTVLEVDRARQLLDRLLEEANVVVLSAPPIERSPDTLTWARTADATVLVARRGRTSGESVTRAVEALRHTRANVVGTILSEGPTLRFR